MNTPQCPNGHGPMVERTSPSADAAWQGTWYDCAPGPAGGRCRSAALDPSAEMLAFHKSLRTAQGALDIEAAS